MKPIYRGGTNTKGSPYFILIQGGFMNNKKSGILSGLTQMEIDSIYCM